MVASPPVIISTHYNKIPFTPLKLSMSMSPHYHLEAKFSLLSPHLLSPLRNIHTVN